MAFSVDLRGQAFVKIREEGVAICEMLEGLDKFYLCGQREVWILEVF